MRIRRSLGLASALALLAALAPQAWAQGADGAEPSSALCTEIEVNGVRAMSYACLTDKLRPGTAPASRAQAASPALQSEAIVQRPSNQLGLFNRAATSTRMGNTFGTSVRPQHPPLQVPGATGGLRGMP